MAFSSISKRQLTEPFELQIARGQIPGHSHIFKYGFNSAVGNSLETIWAQGGLYTWPVAAATLEVTSTNNTADVTAGTGAQQVTLEGLDANYAPISEIVTMTGQTAATTLKSFLRLHRVYVSRAGTGQVNAGTIYCANSSGTHSTGTPTDLTLVYSTIAADEGQTLQTFYTVPAGYTAYVVQVTAGSADGTNATTITFRARSSGQGWRTKDKFIVFKNTLVIPHSVPIPFSAKTDLEMQGIASASTTDVAATIDMILVED